MIDQSTRRGRKLTERRRAAGWIKLSDWLDPVSAARLALLMEQRRMTWTMVRFPNHLVIGSLRAIREGLMIESVENRVLSWLQLGRPLTDELARRNLGCADLVRCIEELRQVGHVIHERMNGSGQLEYWWLHKGK